MKWPWISRSLHEKRVQELQDELRGYREQLDCLRQANVKEIAKWMASEVTPAMIHAGIAAWSEASSFRGPPGIEAGPVVEIIYLAMVRAIEENAT